LLPTPSTVFVWDDRFERIRKSATGRTAPSAASPEAAFLRGNCSAAAWPLGLQITQRALTQVPVAASADVSGAFRACTLFCL